MAENTEYWIEFEPHEQEEPEDILSLPTRIINRDRVQLLDVVGRGAFSQVFKGLFWLSFDCVKCF